MTILSAAFLSFDGSATLYRVFWVLWLGRDVFITPTCRDGRRRDTLHKLLVPPAEHHQPAPQP